MTCRIDQRTLVVLSMISTISCAMARIACTLTGSSLTKARVRPSANCSRRRMSSPSIAMSCARDAARGVVARQVEHGGRLTLRLAGAHQRSVAAAAEGERERVEQIDFRHRFRR